MRNPSIATVSKGEQLHLSSNLGAYHNLFSRWKLFTKAELTAMNSFRFNCFGYFQVQCPFDDGAG